MAVKALKRVERGGRALLIRLVVWLLRRRDDERAPDAARPVWGARPHRVLVLRYERIGDMILTTGLIRAVAESHATITVDVLASTANAPVLREYPHVGSVIVLHRWKPWTYPALVRRLRRGRYDAVIDCMPASPSLTMLLMMLASGAPCRIGIAGRGVDTALTMPAPARAGAVHLIEHLSALGAVFGIDPARHDWRPSIALSDAELSVATSRWQTLSGDSRTRRFLVNVSVGKPLRGWPDERFVAVLGHLRSRAPTAAIIVIGAPAETDRVARIARAGGATAVRTSALRDALALVATADLVFTPDTSIAHAASAFRRPAVAMYSRGFEGRWGLYGAPGHTLASPALAVASLPLEPVLAALDDVLAQVDAPASRESG